MKEGGQFRLDGHLSVQGTSQWCVCCSGLRWAGVEIVSVGKLDCAERMLT